MPSLNILIKPASSLCNMNCEYCFYRDVSDNRADFSHGIMKESVTDALVKRAFEYADQSLSFTFQGGEPTLAGEKYFLAFHSAVKRYNKRGIPVAFSLQTNGYDIPDSLMRIFAEHHYLLGVSLDGKEELHDRLRTAHGMPTYSRILDTLRRLDDYKIEYNILTVITEDVARLGASVYRSLRDRGFRFLQFIPFVADFGYVGEGESYTLTNASYAKFLKDTFKEYRRDFLGGRYVSVRQLDNFVRLAAGGVAECCGMNGTCYANIVVEADGSAYPCDFYVLDEWKMGNIVTDSVASLLASDSAARFVRLSRTVEPECRDCPYLAVCRGGCRRHREGELGAIGLNRYCAAYKEFFSECMPLIVDIARRLCKK